MIEKPRDVIGGSLIMAVGAAFFLLGRDLEFGSSFQMGPGYFPAVLSVILVSLGGMPLIGLWVRMRTIPYHRLFPTIVAFTATGVCSINSNAFDVNAMALFGAVGYALIKLDFEPAPLLLGFVLGPMLEEFLRPAMLISRGDFSVFVAQPLSLALLVVAAVMLALVLMPTVRAKREEAFQE